MKFPLDWLLLNRWYWIIVLSCFAVMIGPLVTIYVMLFMPAILRVIALFGIIICWGIASGYKDWAKARKENEGSKSTYKSL